MKEFSQSKKCYAKWKDNEPQRGRFLGMAAEIINSHAKRAFLSMVSCKEFGEVDAMFTLSERFKSPYALTGRACIGLANNWARNPKTKLLDIEYVFEDGGPDKGGLISSVEHFRHSFRHQHSNRAEMRSRAGDGLRVGAESSSFKRLIISLMKREKLHSIS